MEKSSCAAWTTLGFNTIFFTTLLYQAIQIQLTTSDTTAAVLIYIGAGILVILALSMPVFVAKLPPRTLSVVLKGAVVVFFGTQFIDPQFPGKYVAFLASLGILLYPFAMNVMGIGREAGKMGEKESPGKLPLFGIAVGLLVGRVLVLWSNYTLGVTIFLDVASGIGVALALADPDATCMSNSMSAFPRVRQTMHVNLIVFGIFFVVETAVLPGYVPLLPLVPLEVYILLRLACISTIIILHIFVAAPKLWSPAVILVGAILLLGLGGFAAVFAVVMLAFEFFAVDLLFLFSTLPFREDRSPSRSLCIVNEGLWFVTLIFAVGGLFIFASVAIWIQALVLVGMGGTITLIWARLMLTTAHINPKSPIVTDDAEERATEGDPQ